MTIKIGINGFGRIGRNVLRAAVQNFNDIEIVGINDLLEPDYLAYMLQYDSVHGRFKGEVAVDGNTLIVNGKKIRLTQETRPGQPEVGRGRRRRRDRVHRPLPRPRKPAQKHIDAGAKKVDHVGAVARTTRRCSSSASTTRRYKGEAIISNASCTTNCLAPLAKVLQRQVGHQARPDDHRARRHRDAEDRRRPEQQGLARRPRHPGEHHPVVAPARPRPSAW